MPLFSKTEEEKAAKAAADEEKRVAKAAADEAKRAAKAAEEFNKSPQGQARVAFERGDEIFHFQMALQATHAYVGMVTGGQTYKGAGNDPSQILNLIAKEGWDIVNASVVFMETGSQSRDKLLASGKTSPRAEGSSATTYLDVRPPDPANRREVSGSGSPPSGAG